MPVFYYFDHVIFCLIIYVVIIRNNKGANHGYSIQENPCNHCNPAAGHDEPILNTLNDVFHSTGVDWDIRITHKFGDATRLAKEAVEMGVDLVPAMAAMGHRWKLPMAC